MKKLTLPAAALCALLFCLPLNAQNEANHWYFGINIGIEFKPEGIDTVGEWSNFVATEGGATYSHPQTGALLFYTDGMIVWGADHRIMPGSDYDLVAGSTPSNFISRSTTQSALVVPHPGDPNIYYIFNPGNYTSAGVDRNDLDLNQPFLDYFLYTSYSVVDMRLRGGLGDVVERVVLNPKIEMSERISGTIDCIDEGYWVVTRSLRNNTYFSYRVTADGVQLDPVVSEVGFQAIGADVNGVGQMKISPDGSMLAVAYDSFNDVAFELLDFNRASGRVFNSRIINAPISPFTNSVVKQIYGLAFSPQCEHFFVSSRTGSVLQFSLQNRDASSIQSSMEFLADAQVFDYRSMQIAPDNSIYISKNSRRELAAIRDPDISPSFVADADIVGQFFPVRQSTAGLPNFMDHIFGPAKLNPDCDRIFAGFDVSALEICEGDCIDIVNTTRGDAETWRWEFPGANPASSDQREPGTICFPQAGEYEITLIALHPVVDDTARRTIRVFKRTRIEISGAEQISVCEGAEIQLNVEADEGDIIWSPAEGIDDINSRTPTLTPQVTRWYKVRLEAPNACEVVEDSVLVTVADLPDLVLTPPPPICEGEQVRVNVSGADTYNWSPRELFDDPNSAGPLLTARAGTTYSVTGRNATTGCSRTETFTVEALPLPVAQAAPAFEICRGDAVQLNASGGTRYEWSPRTGLDDFKSPTPTAAPDVSTEYTVTVFNDDGCSLELPVNVVVNDSIDIVLRLPDEQLTEPGSKDSIAIVIEVPAARLPLNDVRIQFDIAIDKTFMRVEGVGGDLPFTTVVGPERQTMTITYTGDITSPQLLLTHLIGTALLNDRQTTDVTIDNVQIDLGDVLCPRIDVQNGRFGIHEYCLGYAVVWRTLLGVQVRGNPVEGSTLHCDINMPSAGDPVELELLNSVGTVVLRRSLSNDGAKQVELDIDASELASGVYFIAVRSTWQSDMQAFLLTR